MSADQLAPVAWPPAPNRVGRAVLQVLAGQPIANVAKSVGMEPIALSDAVEVFTQAGNDALRLHERRTNWAQFYVEFADWTHAERTAAAHLAPALNGLQESGALSLWWFIRKHPCWRLRLCSEPGSQAYKELTGHLDELVKAGHLRRWWPGIYEPETGAFGGAAGMLAAHSLFSADSHHILTRHGQSDVPLGRREISVVLCTVMMQAAGLEWQEQGDVWDRVITEENRSAIGKVLEDRLEGMTRQIRQLLVSDTHPDGPLFGLHGPLHPVAEWATAFRHTGQALKEAVTCGSLDRGIRRVLAYHVIFHWNRAGLPFGAQSALALAARTAILDPPPPATGIG
ncbi:thiopeptide-type bacteriocin biosynthesis protein [Streptomyces sp. NBC_01304]|uniref:thiopeptide-type bacteriocin biosynthesis protein n=1 Tax=Streptomyces sp. NBC_01304 TaxID=2903818 RepID=UPI002E0E969C|nr:thiopeptide-type bacteriocin biosynthesis protein [Streptomyces sp. NBC_01304]